MSLSEKLYFNFDHIRYVYAAWIKDDTQNTFLFVGLWQIKLLAVINNIILPLIGN